MPFIQITMAKGRTADQKRNLLQEVSAAAARATGTPEAAVRVWVVEVDAGEVMAGGTILADKQAAAAADRATS
ncbi:tautomerase family protein [Streptomyces sp. 7R016]|jgi:4-oxalocrotonate tautomerase|uniref:Tautomerase family protein n=1 Tax=Streptomyces spinosisporus TaxID=2927582 RepID=A0ABS9XUI7_9ACTN|nr:tautomerase family protein [Streptomyces spinosisporus]